jgi:hypothetical protein
MQAIDAEAAELDPESSGNRLVNFARAAVDALLPQITEARQMAGVPEGAVLIVETTTPGDRPSAACLWWLKGKLYGGIDPSPGSAGIEPVWVIDRYGPMTVVWMP